MRIAFHPCGSEDDLCFAHRLILQDAANGHFESDLLQPRAANGLLVQLAQIATTNMTVAGEPAHMAIVRQGSSAVGFFIIKKTDFGFGPVNEFWMAGIAPAFRGQGLGRELVREVCDQATSQGRRLFARVSKNSLTMLSILEQSGFIRRGETRAGYVFLERRVT